VYFICKILYKTLKYEAEIFLCGCFIVCCCRLSSQLGWQWRWLLLSCVLRNMPTAGVMGASRRKLSRMMQFSSMQTHQHLWASMWHSCALVKRLIQWPQLVPGPTLSVLQLPVLITASASRVGVDTSMSEQPYCCVFLLVYLSHCYSIAWDRL